MQRNTNENPFWIRWAVTIAIVGTLAVGVAGELRAGGGFNQCEKSARHALTSCRAEALEELWAAVAVCDHLATTEERVECRREAIDEYYEALEECDAVFEARNEICDELPGPFDPQIDPANFVDFIDNPYLPLVPGTTRLYEAHTEDGLETIEVTVTDQKKEILGVSCTVVRDTVKLDGVLVEDTFDWFAQDVDGNVWYMGEIAFNYEDGEIVDIEGSWEAGRDGAKAGIVMQAVPTPGALYRQEFLLGEAEDMGRVASLGASVEVPFGMFDDCLETEDFTPLEPDVFERKYYAAGIGVVLEIDVESGERVELVDVITP